MDNRYHDVLERAGSMQDYNDDHRFNGELGQWQLLENLKDDKSSHDHTPDYSATWLEYHHKKLKDSIQVFKRYEAKNVAEDLFVILVVTTSFCLLFTVVTFYYNKKKDKINNLKESHELGIDVAEYRKSVIKYANFLVYFN